MKIAHRPTILHAFEDTADVHCFPSRPSREVYLYLDREQADLTNSHPEMHRITDGVVASQASWGSPCS